MFELLMCSSENCSLTLPSTLTYSAKILNTKQISHFKRFWDVVLFLLYNSLAIFCVLPHADWALCLCCCVPSGSMGRRRNTCVLCRAGLGLQTGTGQMVQSHTYRAEKQGLCVLLDTSAIFCTYVFMSFGQAVCLYHVLSGYCKLDASQDSKWCPVRPWGMWFTHAGQAKQGKSNAIISFDQH